MQEINWIEHFENSDDVNELNDLINCEAHYVMDTYIPKINILVRPRNKPWITTNIKTNIRKRNRAYKKAKTRNLESDWAKYRKLRNDVIDMIREVKRQYLIKLHNSLVDKSIPPGKWWRIAKNFCKFTNRSSTNTPIKVNGDILVHSVE